MSMFIPNQEASANASPVILANIVAREEFRQAPLNISRTRELSRAELINFITLLYGATTGDTLGANVRAEEAANDTVESFEALIHEFGDPVRLPLLRYEINVGSTIHMPSLRVTHPSGGILAVFVLKPIYQHFVSLDVIVMPQMFTIADQYHKKPDNWTTSPPAIFSSDLQLQLVKDVLLSLNFPLIDSLENDGELCTGNSTFEKFIASWKWIVYKATQVSSVSGDSVINRDERIIGIVNYEGKVVASVQVTGRVEDNQEVIKFISLLPIFCDGLMLNARQVLIDEIAAIMELESKPEHFPETFRQPKEKENKLSDEAIQENTAGKLISGLNNTIDYLYECGLARDLNAENANDAIKRLLVRSMNYAVRNGGHSTGMMEFQNLVVGCVPKESGELDVTISSQDSPHPIITFQAQALPVGNYGYEVPFIDDDGEMMKPVYIDEARSVKLTEALPFGSFWNMVRRNRNAMKNVETMQTLLSEAGCAWSEMDLGVDLEIQTKGVLYSDNRLIQTYTRYARYAFYIRAEQESGHKSCAALGFVRMHNDTPTDVTLDLAGVDVDGVINTMAFEMVAIVKKANPNFVPNAEIAAEVQADLACAAPPQAEVAEEVMDSDSDAGNDVEIIPEEEPGTERLYTETEAAQMACMEINAVFPTVEVVKGVFNMTIGWATSARMLKPREAFFNYAEVLAEASPAGVSFELKVKRSGKTHVVIDIHVLVSGHVRATHHDFIDLAKVPAIRSGAM